MPNVDDHGLEVLKKAARDLLTGGKAKNDYALQVWLMNPTTGGGGSGGALTLQKISFSISALQVGTWVQVPIVTFTSVADVQVFDAADLTQLFIDWRLSAGNVVEIRSNSVNTYTIHVLGS